MQRGIAVGAIVLASCFSGYESPDAPRVHRGRFENRTLLTGELEAARGEVISVPQLPSWQTSIKWMADDGARVNAGDKVVELDNTPFVTDLDQKRGEETQALQELKQKESESTADLRQKEVELDKKKGEFEKAEIEATIPKEIVSAREYQDRQMKLKRARTEYEKARDVLASEQKAAAADRANLELKIERARRDVATAEQAIETLVLRAPREGIVVIKDHPWESRKLQTGDSVWVGFRIAMLPELDSLQVKAALPDVDDGRVTAGMPVVVTLDGYPSIHVPGKIASISAVAREERTDSLRRSFDVIVKLDRIDAERMRPGLSARVEVNSKVIRDALLVPRTALDFSKPQVVARLAGGKSAPVTLGPCNAQECVVTSGVDEGARLATP